MLWFSALLFCTVGGVASAEPLPIRTTARPPHLQQSSSPCGRDFRQRAFWGHLHRRLPVQALKVLEKIVLWSEHLLCTMLKSVLMTRSMWSHLPSSWCTTSSREWWGFSSLEEMWRRRKSETRRISYEWSPQVRTVIFQISHALSFDFFFFFFSFPSCSPDMPISVPLCLPVNISLICSARREYRLSNGCAQGHTDSSGY